jgi:hypothetical protein
VTMWHTPSRERLNSCYFDMDEFLEDMRAGTLKEGFTLSALVWNGLVKKVNTDSAFASEIMDYGVLMLMAVDARFEIEGLISMAEVCR